MYSSRETHLSVIKLGVYKSRCLLNFRMGVRHTRMIMGQWHLKDWKPLLLSTRHQSLNKRILLILPA